MRALLVLALALAGCAAPADDRDAPPPEPTAPRSEACGLAEIPAPGDVPASAAEATVRRAFAEDGTAAGSWFANATARTHLALVDGNGTIAPADAPCAEPTSAGWPGDGRLHVAWQVELTPQDPRAWNLVGYGWVDTHDGVLLHHLTAT